MKNLLPGILFATIGLAILDSASGIICASAEYIKSTIGLKVAKNQVEINNLMAGQSNEPVRAIGFYTEDCEDEDEEYYEE